MPNKILHKVDNISICVTVFNKDYVNCILDTRNGHKTEDIVEKFVKKNQVHDDTLLDKNHFRP